MRVSRHVHPHPQTASNHVSLLTVLVIIRLHRYRSSFNTILASSNTTRSRFFRLFATASTLILGITPLQIWIVATHYPRQNYPFNFRQLHDPKTWNTSVVLPSTVLYDRWINLACGFLIFFFFGMGKDAKGMYREWLAKVGLGRLFPVLLMESHGSSHRGGLSSGSSKKSLWRKSSWIATTERYVFLTEGRLLKRITDMESSSRATCSRASTSPAIASHFNHSDTPASPTRPLTAFFRRFDPRRRVEQPGTKYELPIFNHPRQPSDGEDRGVLISKEIKRESCVT
jgi:pheromone a factor receptor